MWQWLWLSGCSSFVTTPKMHSSKSAIGNYYLLLTEVWQKKIKKNGWISLTFVLAKLMS